MTIEEKVIHLYRDKQMSVRQVAKEMNINYMTICNIINEHGQMRDHKIACKLRSTDDEYIERVAAAKIGTKNAAAKLNDEKVVKIRATYPKLLNSLKPIEAQRTLAEDYGVARGTISDIIYKRTWKHI